MDELNKLFNKISIDDDNIKLINDTIKHNEYDDDDVNMLINGIKIMSLENNSKKRKPPHDTNYIKLILRIINECKEKKSTLCINNFVPKWSECF